LFTKISLFGRYSITSTALTVGKQVHTESKTVCYNAG
jgi:hypothetical protein